MHEKKILFWSDNFFLEFHISKFYSFFRAIYFILSHSLITFQTANLFLVIQRSRRPTPS